MSLVTFLKENGYIQIPLSKSGVGHFHTDGFLDDRPISILIDTGASSTVFSLDVAREMNLPLTRLAAFGGGAGAAQLEVHRIQDARFMLSEVSPRLRALVALDLSNVNQALARKGSGQVDAILGADVMETYAAVIDYGSSSLYLKMEDSFSSRVIVELEAPI